MEFCACMVNRELGTICQLSASFRSTNENIDRLVNQENLAGSMGILPLIL